MFGRGRGEATPSSGAQQPVRASLWEQPLYGWGVQQALPRLHPHTAVLAPVSLKGLNPYLSGVSRKPPREQGRIKAEVGRKSAPVAQRCPSPAGCGSPGAAALGRRALSSPLPQWRPMEERALDTISSLLSESHLQVLPLPGAGRGRAPGPGVHGEGGRSELPSPRLLQTIFIDFPAPRAISVTSVQEFAPPIILHANLSG